MKFATFAFACLVLASPALAGRELMQSPGTRCASFVSVKLQIKHGRCSGSAFTSCRTLSFFEETVKQSTDGIFSGELCKTVDVSAQATAIARAIATAYTDAFSRMRCSANAVGYGCAFGVSQGDSFARSFASAFAKVLAGVFPPNSGVEAVCLAEVEALASGFAQASSFALSNSCVTNAGSASTFVSQFTSAVTKLITKAIVTARARACKKGDVANSLCKATVEGSSKPILTTTNNPFQRSSPGIGGGVTGGTTGGSATALKNKQCNSPVEFKCCLDLSLRKVTGCPGFQVTNGGPAGNILRRINADEECFCH